MKLITVLLCLGCGLVSGAQVQQDNTEFATADNKSSSPSARDETIENEIEIELPSNGGNTAFFMTFAAMDRRLRATERRLEELQRQNEGNLSFTSLCPIWSFIIEQLC